MKHKTLLRDANGELLINPNTGVVMTTPCKDGIPLFQGLLGLKVLLGYIPLIFCAFYLIEDKKELILLGRIFLILAIICCVLGLAQYWMLRTGRCQGTSEAVGDRLFQSFFGR